MPDRRTGHWIPKRTGVDPDDPFDIGNAVCSVCNEPMRINLDGRLPEFEGIFCCPHCGAKMDGEVE